MSDSATPRQSKLPLSGFLDRILTKLGFRGRTLVIAIPTLWLFVFFVIPFLVVAKISLSEAMIARPPYSSISNWEDGVLNLTLNFGNYLFLLEDSLYYSAYVESVKIAFVSTVFALLIGFPMAYTIARSPDSRRNILLMLVILPFWTSFLLRVYAWIGFFENQWLDKQTLDVHRDYRRTAYHVANRFCRVCGDRLYLPAVHDPAALCQSGETG